MVGCYGWLLGQPGPAYGHGLVTNQTVPRGMFIALVLWVSLGELVSVGLGVACGACVNFSMLVVVGCVVPGMASSQSLR